MITNNLHCLISNWDLFNRNLPVVRSEILFQTILNQISDRPLQPDSIRIHFLKHEESAGKTKHLAAGGPDQEPLNEAGPAAANELAKTIFALQQEQRNHFAGIFCASSERTKETAVYISEVLKMPLQIDDRLRQKHWGFYHGLPICEKYQVMKLEGEMATEKLETFQQKFDFKFEKEPTDEESLQQVFDRVIDFMADVKKNEGLLGKEIIVITHVPILKVIFSAAIAAEQECDLEYHWFDFISQGKVVIDVNSSGKLSLSGVNVESIKFRGLPKYPKSNSYVTF